MNNPANGYCQCGCGRKTTVPTYTNLSTGYIKGRPMRFVKGHHPKRKTHGHTVDKETGCWIWDGPLTKYGYPGAIRKRGAKAVFAYRHYYETKFGKTPEGMELDHICRNRACVNPDHLEPVTKTENIHRGLVAKLKKEDVLEIRRLHKNGVKQLKLAEIYKMSKSAINKAITGKAWANL